MLHFCIILLRHFTNGQNKNTILEVQRRFLNLAYHVQYTFQENVCSAPTELNGQKGHIFLKGTVPLKNEKMYLNYFFKPASLLTQ